MKVGDKKVHFDLRTPCRDCPFRRDVPHHEGVAVDLIPLLTALTGTGNIAHSCHKTDSRSDCESAQKYSGKLQHCAGLLIMAHKGGLSTVHMIDAEARGEFDPKKLDTKAPVFAMREMVESYRDWAKSKITLRFHRRVGT